jgi:hypothetical protein
MGVELNMVKKVTMKPKKDDILKGYDEMAEKCEKNHENVEAHDQMDQLTKKNPKRQDNQEAFTVERIVKELADLKLCLNRTLTDISDRLISEVNKLEAIKKEIHVETEYLNDVHSIHVEADSLRNFIHLLEDKKRSIEQEMESMKGQWTKEQREHEMAVKEHDERLKKERDRDQEEYSYNLSMKRKKEKDSYDEEKALMQRQLALEKELKMKDIKEREENLKSREEELATLRDQVKNFPVDLSKTIEKVKQETKAQIEKELKQKEELQRRETEGDKKVYELKIKNLEDTMLKQSLQIDGLSKQLDTSSKQVITIANKAIEGASGYKVSSSFNEEMLREPVRDEKTKK